MYTIVCPICFGDKKVMKLSTMEERDCPACNDNGEMLIHKHDTEELIEKRFHDYCAI